MSPFAEKLMDQLYEAPNLRLTAIVEMAGVPFPVRERLMERFAQETWPILHQECFANLRDIGPWLFSSGEYLSLDSQYDFYYSLIKLAPDAPCAWLVSSLETSRLARHLGHSATARAPDGNTHLLRFYRELAFPQLYARQDLPGITDLLAPIKSWWALATDRERQVWRHYGCHDQPEHCAVPMIRLDQACWDALAGNPLGYPLCDLLAEELAFGNPGSCHGTRLAKVHQLLAEAQEDGLSQLADQKDYVVFLARHGQSLRASPAWKAALADARDNAVPLAQAFERHLSP